MNSYEQSLTDLIPPDARAVLVVRRGGCGCKLGMVYRTSAGHLLAGRRRVTGEATPGKVRSERVRFVQLLDDPSRPEDYGCRHGSGMLPLADILAAARTAKRRHTFVID